MASLFNQPHPLSSGVIDHHSHQFRIDDDLLVNGSMSARSITSNGNISIGTTTSNALLQLSQTHGNRKIVLFESANNDNQFLGFGTQDSNLRYQISSSISSSHIFYTGFWPGGSTELMRIKGNGNVLIGTTTDPGFKLNVNGTGNYSGNLTAHNIFPAVDNTYNIGSTTNRYNSIFATNNVINTSDSCLKEYQPLNYGLNELLQVETIKYKWKEVKQPRLDELIPKPEKSEEMTEEDFNKLVSETEENNKKITEANNKKLQYYNLEKDFQYYGFKADQLNNIFPELVYDEDKDAPMQMAYTELIAVCVNAIKELKNENDGLKSKQSSFEDRIKLLESK